MPVRRYRDMEAARAALWAERGDADLADRIRRLWAFGARLAPGVAPRGVRRFRTIEEAQEDRDRWVAQRAQELRARRLRRNAE